MSQIAGVESVISGQVISGGSPVNRATVTLWAATAGAPVQLGREATDAGGCFTIDLDATPATDASLYLIAEGGRSAADSTEGANECATLMTVLGSVSTYRMARVSGEVRPSPLVNRAKRRERGPLQ